MVEEEDAMTEVPPPDQEFATLRELLAALDYESDSEDQVADLIEEYADAYMDEDLGMNLFVNLGDGDDGEGMSLLAKMSFYTDDAVDMWVLERTVYRESVPPLPRRARSARCPAARHCRTASCR